jgi:3-phenylpropionate/trans-cinnamate dioxygenase ferredoxin component
MADWIDVAPLEYIRPGATWKLDLEDGTQVAVFNLEGKLYAIEDVCTHDGGTLTGGELQGEELVCPRHGARFSIITGEALSPPAYESVATFGVRVEDGVVQIRDTRWE